MRSFRLNRRVFANLLVVVICLTGFFSVLRNSHGQTASYDQLISEGRALLKGGKGQEAAVKAKAAADMAPDRYEAYELAAMVGVARKDNPAASAFLQMAIQRSPDHKRFELYDALRSVDPAAVERLYRQRLDAGKQARQDKAFARAGKEYYEAWKLKPADVASGFDAAASYVAVEDYPWTVTILRELSNSKEQKAADEAKRIIDKLGPAIAKKAAAYYQSGNQQLARGDNNGAIENLSQALSLNPNLALAYNDRGQAHLNNKDYDRAIQDFDQAIKLAPQLASAFQNRGKAYVSKGLVDQGMKDLDQAIKLGPSQTDVIAGLTKSASGTKDGAEMVEVPAGEFWMGSDYKDLYGDEKPRRRVYLDGFRIDKYEVTNSLYRRFIDATGHRAPAFWTSDFWNEDRRFNGARQPVVGVDWNDATAYCAWAGKRLPTEAEWEKAARGTDGRKYPWGDQWYASNANSRESGINKTVDVGSYPSGASPYGAQDMAGNVLEWVADWYDDYKRAPDHNPKGPPAGPGRVLRGGQYMSDNVLQLRTSSRGHKEPTFLDPVGRIGFRCAQ